MNFSAYHSLRRLLFFMHLDEKVLGKILQILMHKKIGASAPTLYCVQMAIAHLAKILKSFNSQCLAIVAMQAALV